MDIDYNLNILDILVVVLTVLVLIVTICSIYMSYLISNSNSNIENNAANNHDEKIKLLKENNDLLTINNAKYEEKIKILNKNHEETINLLKEQNILIKNYIFS